MRDDYSLDFFALGMNRRGKLSPLCSSMSIFMSYIDENGEPVSDLPHPGTGPVPADVRERALAVEVVPHPR